MAPLLAAASAAEYSLFLVSYISDASSVSAAMPISAVVASAVKSRICPRSSRSARDSWLFMSGTSLARSQSSSSLLVLHDRSSALSWGSAAPGRDGFLMIAQGLADAREKALQKCAIRAVTELSGRQ